MAFCETIARESSYADKALFRSCPYGLGSDNVKSRTFRFAAWTCLIALLASSLPALPGTTAAEAIPEDGLLTLAREAGTTLRPDGLPEPERVMPATYVPTATKDWLLVEDNVPWFQDSVAIALNQYGYTWDAISSWGLPFVNLLDYRGIIVPSDQVFSFHDNMALNAPLLQAYVLAGGTLVVNYAQGGWNSYPPNPVPWIPGGTTFVIDYSDLVTITNPLSPMTFDLTDGEIQGWFASTHGILGGPATNVIMASLGATPGPSYIAYPFGAGKVYVTMHTVEWGFANGYSADFLRNELAAIYLPLPL